LRDWRSGSISENSMIQNILFDLGNVLVPLRWSKTFALLKPLLPKRLARLLDENREEFKKLIIEPANESECGRIEFEEFYQIMLRTLELDVSRVEFKAIWCSMFEADEKMIRFGAELAKKYQVFLVSNTSRIHYEYIIEHFPEAQFFKAAALSFELGVMKPDPAYYEKAVAKFRIDPSESVLIDDLSQNVLGAIDAGMKGIVFENITQLAQDLEKLGVNAFKILE
jgi:glucose-1-phosphatase